MKSRKQELTERGGAVGSLTEICSLNCLPAPGRAAAAYFLKLLPFPRIDQPARSFPGRDSLHKTQISSILVHFLFWNDIAAASSMVRCGPIPKANLAVTQEVDTLIISLLLQRLRQMLECEVEYHLWPGRLMSSSTQHLFRNHGFIRYVRQAGKSVSFHRRDVIFSAGDRSNWVFFLERGSAKLTLTSAHGKEAVIDILHEGEFCGESALYGGHLPRPTNAVAVTELQMTRIGRDPLLRLLHLQPEVCDDFISSMVLLATQLEMKMAAFLLYGSQHRLASALLSVAEGQHGKFHRLPKISQQDLAGMIGITRQRVNTLLRQFRELGFVDYARGLRVHDSIKKAVWKD